VNRIDTNRLVGQKFKRLTVIKYDDVKSKPRRIYWLCKCECGKETSVREDGLKRGDVISCGCARKGRRNKKDRIGINEVGIKYNRLTIIEVLPIINGKQIRYLCRCDCGNLTEVNRDKLVRGNTKSCGCLMKEKAKKLGLSNRIEKGQANFNVLYGNYKASAKHRNLEFSLNKEEFRNLTDGNCYYCGMSPQGIQVKKDSNGAYVYNGIDRIDNNKGYISGNVVACCKWCNRSKNTRKLDDFINWINEVHKHLTKTGILPLNA
jgi:elongation factor P hydroxylase